MKRYYIQNYPDVQLIEHRAGALVKYSDLPPGADDAVAAHAPKQEPSVPVSELKAWRNTASIPLTYSDAVAFDDLIRQAEAAGV